MAGYRQFHTKFWKDSWVIELEPLERYLFTYLFTNEQSSISGIFELPMRIIQNETGLEREFIVATLDKFQKANKIVYKDNVIWVVKMRQHHQNASPQTMKKVNADIAWIPDCEVKNAYRYYQETGKMSTDTVSIPYAYPIVEDKAEDKTEAESAPSPLSHLSAVIATKLKVSEYTGGAAKWNKAISEILETGATDEDIDAAIKYLDDKGLSIVGPWSIVSSVVIAKGQRERGISSNGSKPKSHRRGIGEFI